LLSGKLQLDGDMVSPSIGELSMYNICLSGNVSRVMYKGTMMRGGAVVAVKRLLSIGVGRVHDYYEFSMEIQTLWGASGTATSYVCLGSWPTRRPTCWCMSTCRRGLFVKENSGNLAGEAVSEEVEPRRTPFQIHSVRNRCKQAAHLVLLLHSISTWCTSSRGRTGSGVRPVRTYFSR
jgi:hypothetical protein